MLQGWFVIAVALGYIGLLFGIASYGDRRIGGAVGQRLWIYPLSLAIYCTSWTFFGSVGLATRNGFDFLAIYIGPILVVGLAYPLIIRITRLSKAQNIVSIADFIGARYGKHQGVAAAVALIAIVGTIPYIALQLKAISSSLGAIVVPLETFAGPVQPMLGGPPLLVSLSLAGVLGRAWAADGRRSAAVRRTLARRVRGPVRHAPHRCDRAPARPHAGGGGGIGGQARRLWRRRGLRHLQDVRRAGGAVRQGIGAARHRRRAHLRYQFRHDGGDDAALVLRRNPAAAAILRDGGGEQERRRDPPRRLGVSALPRHHQPVRDAGRARRHADLRAGDGRQRHVRAGAADRGGLGDSRARRVRRRPVGGGGDGDRRVGRARHHGVERHRGAARAAPPRRDQCRHPPPHGAPRGDLRGAAARLSLLPPRRRGAARGDRADGVRRRRATRAGVLRRAHLAPRHGRRRARRHDRRHPDLGLHAAAAEPRRPRARPHG